MIYLNLQMPRGGSGSAPDPMLQILQMLTSDREAERAERQAKLATLQQIAQMAHNNQGHGNQDHHGSKLKNFQNTNPPETLEISLFSHDLSKSSDATWRKWFSPGPNVADPANVDF